MARGLMLYGMQACHAPIERISTKRCTNCEYLFCIDCEPRAVSLSIERGSHLNKEAGTFRSDAACKTAICHDRSCSAAHILKQALHTLRSGVMKAALPGNSEMRLLCTTTFC